MRSLARRALNAIPLSAAARHSAAVILHHGVFHEPPADLRDGLHNVTPDELHRQLESLKGVFTFVSVDELAEAADPRGLASLTFDDAYKSVVEFGLPVLEALDVPATIFVNGASLRGDLFWRDKLRALINRGLAEDFAHFADELANPRSESLYRYTKHPANSSATVHRLLDEYLEQRLKNHGIKNHCFDGPQCFVAHPLLAYGNHSEHHYVLASLTREEQVHEIEGTHRALERQANIERSRLFSIPFGGVEHFDADTLAIIRDFGYRGALLSRQRLHRPADNASVLPLVERFMPGAKPIGSEVRRLMVAALAGGR